MLARFTAFLIWALVAAATAYWGLRIFVRPTVAPSHAMAVSNQTPARGDWSRLMGAEEVAAVAVAPAISTRFQLLGLMAGQVNATEASALGVALISVDGKPARAFRAGARIEDDLVLKGLGVRSAAIGTAQGPVVFTLELPALPEPARGALPQPNGIPGGITLVREPMPMPAPAVNPSGAVGWALPPQQSSETPPPPLNVVTLPVELPPN